MMRALIFCIAASCTMPCANRLRVKAGLGVIPSRMPGLMMQQNPVLCAPMNLSYIPTVPSDHVIPGLWTNTRGRVSTHEWKAQISNWDLPRDNDYGMDGGQLLHSSPNRKDSMTPAASRRANVQLSASLLKAPQLRRYMYNKAPAILSYHPSRDGMLKQLGNLAVNMKGRTTKKAAQLVRERALAREQRLLAEVLNVFEKEAGTWQVGKLLLGQGHYGQVWQLTRKNPYKKYAGKIMKKREHDTDEEFVARCQKEVAMQRLVQEGPHGPNDFLVKAEPDLIKLPSGDLVIIMELMPGGKLTYKVEQFRKGRQVKHVFRQIVAGVKEMHEAGVVHRDLNLQNIFCDKDRVSPTCKVGGFMSAANLPLQPEEQTTVCGSPEYRCPEAYRADLEPGWGKEADVWALGVILYRLLVGRSPSEYPNRTGEDGRQALASWFAGPAAHKTDNLGGIDQKAIELLSHMLDENPRTRYTIWQVFEDPYLEPTGTVRA